MSELQEAIGIVVAFLDQRINEAHKDFADRSARDLAEAQRKGRIRPIMHRDRLIARNYALDLSRTRFHLKEIAKEDPAHD